MSDTGNEAVSATLSRELPAMSQMRADARWQQRLLPVMVRMLIGLTAFFFIATLAQLYYLHRAIQIVPQTDVRALLNPAIDAEFRARVLMEANLLERRYHQANVFLMSRVWVHYLGFVTGMILALVGAVFILGKLQTEASQLTGKAAGNSFDFRSTSPGLVLAVLGVILMSTTILTNHPIETADSAIYMRAVSEKPIVRDDPVAPFAPKNP